MPERVVIGNAELWHGDCRELAHSLRFDAIVTDPGIGYERGGGGNGLSQYVRLGNIVGDDAPFDPTWLIEAVPAGGLVLPAGEGGKKPAPKVAIFGAEHMAQHIPRGVGSWCVWDKSCGTGPNDSFACGGRARRRSGASSGTCGRGACAPRSDSKARPMNGTT